MSSLYVVGNRKKNRNIIFISIFLFMWVLFGWNNGNADYENYNHIYNMIGYYGEYAAVEKGYEFVCRISNIIGLSYNSFLIIYSLVGISLIASTVKKYTKKYVFVFSLYFLYPFLIDIVQNRNFMAMSIIIFSIRYLVNNNKYNRIKYIILVIIASSFHNSALFYLLFLLVSVKSNKKLLIITIGIIITGILFKPALPNIVKFLFPNKTISIYFNSTTNIYAKMLFILYLGISLGLVYYSYRLVKYSRYMENIKLSKYELKDQIQFAETIMKINILILITYIFLIIDVDFIRLYRNILPLNYILFSLIKNDLKDKEGKMLHKIMVIYFVGLSSFAFIFLQTYYTVVHAVFNNNIIFNIFK